MQSSVTSVNTPTSIPHCNLSDQADALSNLIEHLRDEISRRLPFYPSRPNEHQAFVNLNNGYVALETGAAHLRVVIDQIRRESF